MPQRSTFVPRIKVPHQFSNILLNRPKMGLRTVSSNSCSASLRNTFTNSAKDYIKYDIGIFNKYHRTRMPRFGYIHLSKNINENDFKHNHQNNNSLA